MLRSDVNVKPMKVTELVEHALDGIEHDRLEIRPGLASMLKIMSCVAPNFMVKQLGKPVDCLRRAFSLAFSAGGIAVFIQGGWQPNESGAVFGWRRRFLFDFFRGRRLRRWRGPMGSASPRPDRNSWLRGGCVVLSLSDFRLARSQSLSLGVAGSRKPMARWIMPEL